VGTSRVSSERGPRRRDRVVERFLELRPTVLARMQASVPADLQAELGTATPHQLQALVLLPEDGLTMHDLAGRLRISGPAACTLADRLVSQDLAQRLASPGDRRIVRLAPTDKGRALAERYREAQRRAVAALLRSLDDRQVAAWVDIMETLAGDDEPEEAAPASRSLVGARR
jgi:DNA-binding MarR family transcriptional regulator